MPLPSGFQIPAPGPSVPPLPMRDLDAAGPPPGFTAGGPLANGATYSWRGSDPMSFSADLRQLLLPPGLNFASAASGSTPALGALQQAGNNAGNGSGAPGVPASWLASLLNPATYAGLASAPGTVTATRVSGATVPSGSTGSASFGPVGAGSGAPQPFGPLAGQGSGAGSVPQFGPVPNLPAAPSAPPPPPGPAPSTSLNRPAGDPNRYGFGPGQIMFNP